MRDIRDAARFTAGRCSQNLHGPAPRPQQSRDELEQRGLAATVGTHDRHERADGNLEIHILQRDSVAVACIDIDETNRHGPAGRAQIGGCAQIGGSPLSWGSEGGVRRGRHRSAITS